MGLLFKADKLAAEKPPAGGLLKYSQKFLKKKKKPQAEKISAGPELSQLIEDFNQNIQSISSVADLIRYLAASYVKYLKLEKLACLMYDPVKDCFSSWISVGLVNNFSQELNFTRNEIMALIPSSQPVEVNKSKLLTLKKYLDTGDYTSIGKITLIPFYFRSFIIGLLLIADLPPIYTQASLFKGLFQTYSTITAFMKERIEKKNAVDHYSFQSKVHMTTSMEKQLEYSLKNKTVYYILKLSLEKTIAPVMEDNPKLNSHLLKEEVLLLLAQLFKHIGYLYNLQNGDILFVINKLRKLDLRILSDQLLKTMQRFFSDLLIENNFELDFDVYAYPTEGETVKSLLAKYYESDEHLS